MSKSRTPDILKKSHRHLEVDERAKAKEELRHDILELDSEDDGEEPVERGDGRRDED